MKLNSASTFLFKVTQVSNPFAPYQLSYSQSIVQKENRKMTLVDDRDRKSSFGFGGRRSMKRYDGRLSVKEKKEKQKKTRHKEKSLLRHVEVHTQIRVHKDYFHTRRS